MKTLTRQQLKLCLALVLAVTDGCLSAGVNAQPTHLDIEHRAPAMSPLPLGPAHPEWMAAHIVNVGQGSGAILEFSCGLVVVDTGGQEEAATNWKERFRNYLESVFVRRPDLNRTIDVVYITHPHPDHVLGIDDLIASNNYRIRYVVTDDTKTGGGQSSQRKLISYANGALIPAVQIKTSLIKSHLGLTSRNIDPLRCNKGWPELRVLWGTYDQPPQWSASVAGNENNQSVAVRIRYGESSFLITGDMEKESIEKLLQRYATNPGLLDIDVYVAGHHGAANGTTEALIKALKPELAVISSGNPADKEDGWSAYSYGHPSKATLSILSNPQTGVTLARPLIHVAVGTKGRDRVHHRDPEYETFDLDRAVFDTGWDGDVVVLANTDGTKRVIIN